MATKRSPIKQSQPLRFRTKRKIKDTPLLHPDDPSANKSGVTFDFDENSHSLSDWEKLNRMTTSLLKDPSTVAPLPSNKELIERQATVSQDLSADLHGMTTKVREFILRQVIPFTSSIDYGHSDAVEVIDMALGDKPNTAAYFSALRSMAYAALMVKTSLFLADLADLKGEARALFLLQTLPKDAPSGSQDHLMSLLQSALNQPPVQEPVTERRRSKPRNS